MFCPVLAGLVLAGTTGSELATSWPPGRRSRHLYWSGWVQAPCGRVIEVRDVHLRAGRVVPKWSPTASSDYSPGSAHPGRRSRRGAGGNDCQRSRATRSTARRGALTLPAVFSRRYTDKSRRVQQRGVARRSPAQPRSARAMAEVPGSSEISSSAATSLTLCNCGTTRLSR